MIRLSVTVTGPPLAICRLNRGITLPLLPSTLPNRVQLKEVLLCAAARLRTIISQRRLVAPITLVGFTALSVEIMMNFSTPYFSETRTMFQVPNTLFFTASEQLCSIRGTCLWAAAWSTTWGLYVRNTLSSCSASRTLAISTAKFSSLP